MHTSTGRKLVILLSIVFFFSGFAALLYQVVWQRLLTTHYGVGSISITLIVSIYMLGLGFGALIGGRMAERSRDQIRLYAMIEIGIAVFGASSLTILDFLGTRTAGSSHFASMIWITVFLAVPTLLMGTTLPIVTKIFSRAIKSFLSTVSLLYFLNTVGAACGALLGAWILVSFLGLATTCWVAAAINALLAVLILRGRRLAAQVPEVEQVEEASTGVSGPVLGRLAYPLVLVTGFLAIGYEIIWFRMNEILTKNSPYSFATVLFVYLMGIAFGSLGANRFRKRFSRIDERRLFFGIQGGIALWVGLSITIWLWLTVHTPADALTRYSFSHHPHPYLSGLVGRPAEGTKETLKALWACADIVIWPVFLLGIPTLLMGASFPLISALSMREPGQAGRTVGRVYFFNVLGNVFGGACTGFLLLPMLGTERSLLLFICVGLGIGVFSLSARRYRRLAFGVLAIALFVLVFPARGEFYEVVHYSDARKGYETHFEEGVDAVVLSYHSGEKVQHYISGLAHGSRPLIASWYEISELARRSSRLKEVLLIGYGTGVYAEALLAVPGLEQLTIVELSGSAMRNLRKIPFIDDMCRDPRVTLIIDDGRRFLMQTERRFDAVVMDPLDPLSAYSNNIYSLEFFQLAKSHLREGGTLLSFVANNAVVAGTIMAAFKNAMVWRFYVIASDGGFADHRDMRDAMLAPFSSEERAMIMRADRWYLGNAEAIRPRLKGIPINRDWRPVAEYFLGVELGPGSRLDPRTKWRLDASFP